jgi:hypothetical protein
MSNKYETSSIAQALLDSLPKLRPEYAVLLSRFDPAGVSELVRRLRSLDEEAKASDAA